MFDGPKVALILLGVLLPLLGLGIYMAERRHSGRGRRRGREPERLPLFGTDQLSIRTQEGYESLEPESVAAVAPPPPRPRVPTAPAAAPARPAPVAAPVAAPPSRPIITPPPAPAPVSVGTSNGVPTAEHPILARRAATAPPPQQAAAPAPASSMMLDAAIADGETLRFTVPADGTVEFLPGRLEVIAGPEAGKEIRFARAMGEHDVEVTFGRSEGPPNRHIQILARTVSRRHAIMSLIDDHWQLTNLSSTNPVVLNGRVLAGNEVAPLLVEGDRIEMGEVVFVFHDA